MWRRRSARQASWTRWPGRWKRGCPVDFAAVDAREALAALGEITGENAEEQIVDAVFRHFCVGK